MPHELTVLDKAVLHSLDKLLIGTPRVGSLGWFKIVEIKFYVKRLIPEVTNCSIKQCLDQFVANGVIDKRYFWFTTLPYYVFRLLPEVMYLRRKLRTDALHGVLNSCNVTTQAVYTSALEACTIFVHTKSTKVVYTSVETVYNQRLIERVKQGSF